MDFGFREEEDAVVELARKILEDHATNQRKRALEVAGTPYDGALWQALAQSNLLGTAIPEAFGGTALGFVALCLATACFACWWMCPWTATAVS